MRKRSLGPAGSVLAVAILATAANSPEAMAANPKCKPKSGGASKWTCTSDIKAKGPQAKAPRTMPLWGLRTHNRF